MISKALLTFAIILGVVMTPTSNKGKDSIELPVMPYIEVQEESTYVEDIIEEVESVEEEKCECDNVGCYICIYKEWDEELKIYTQELCMEYGIPYNIVLAIIFNESGFQEDAYSTYGNTVNYGLMQINSTTYNFLKENIGLNSLEELFNPKINILAGITILKYHRGYVDNDKDMLFRYQVGERNFNRMRKEGIYSTPLLNRVLNKADEFKALIQ